LFLVIFQCALERVCQAKVEGLFLSKAFACFVSCWDF